MLAVRMVSMAIYLLRHGETLWNANGRFQGALDSPLTGRGRQQAALLGRLLASETGERQQPLQASVSPLGRAQATAAIVAEHVPLRPVADPRLSEVSLGAWDGLSHHEIDAEYPGALAGADAFDWYFRAPGGETVDRVRDRVASWLDDMAKVDIVAISHGLTGRILRGVYLGLTQRAMLELPVPQDGLFVLDGGTVRLVSAPGSVAEEA
ncbi:MAG: histidine phosphatase family protein [Phreatobacter sp.]